MKRLQSRFGALNGRLDRRARNRRLWSGLQGWIPAVLLLCAAVGAIELARPEPLAQTLREAASATLAWFAQRAA